MAQTEEDPVCFVVGHIDTCHGDYEYDDNGGVSQCGAKAFVKAVFADKNEAEAYALQLSRNECNDGYDGPFQETNEDGWAWAERIHLPPQQFLDWLLDAGIEPPDWLTDLVEQVTTEPFPDVDFADFAEILEWWRESYDEWDELQIRKLLEVCYCELFDVTATAWHGPDLFQAQQKGE